MTIAPMISPDCIINVNSFCQTIDGSLCNDIPEIDTRCDGTPTRLTMRFKGGACAQSQNFQTEDLFECHDYNDGPPTETGDEAFIVVTNAQGGDITYHEGCVSVGDVFDITDEGNEVDERINVTIYSSEDKLLRTILQTVVYHSSCSGKLFLKDTFGSVQLVEFENQSQSIVSCFVDTFVAFTILNEGEADTTLVSLISESNVFETFDLTDKVHNKTLPSGENLVIQQPFQIDMTSQQEYVFNSTVVGASGSSFDCVYNDVLRFEVGNQAQLRYPTNSPTSVVTDFPTKIPEDAECRLKAHIECRVNGERSSDCQNLVSPVGSKCTQEDEPFKIIFIYAGGDCTSSNNDQKNFECQDSGDGPNVNELVFVTTNGRNGAVVRLGETYHYEALSNESTGIIEVTISNIDLTSGRSGSMIQTLRIVTKCDEDDSLALTKKYGALQLVGFENYLQGMVSIFADITMIYYIKNQGSSNANVTSAIITSAFSGDVSYLNSPLVIEHGDNATFHEDAHINLLESVSTIFAFEFNAQGITLAEVPCKVTAGWYNFTLH